MSEKLDEFAEEELTPLERQKLRRVIQENEQAHFLWSWLGRAIILGGVIASAVIGIKNFILQYVTFR